MDSLNKNNIKRILYFGYFDIMKSNGPGVNEFEFTRVLAKHYGKELWCVLPKPSAEVPHLEDVNTLIFRRPHHLNPISIFLTSIYLAVRMAWIFRRNRINLVVARMWYMPIALLILTVVFRLPFALKTAGVPVSIRRRHILSRIYWGFDDILQGYLLGRAILVDAVSHAYGEMLLRFVQPEKIAVIQNAANTDFFQPMDNRETKAELGIPDKWPVLGYVGGSPSERGARQLLETAKRILPEFPDLHVLIVGWDQELKHEEAEAEKIGIASHVRFLGQQPYSNIPALMNTIDVGFSFGPAHQRVVFSAQKAFQFFACGIPVVSIRENHEFIAENDLGALAEAHDFNAIAEATRTWAHRLKANHREIQQHIRAYAVKHLSVDQALQTRLDFWARNLAGQINPNA